MTSPKQQDVCRKFSSSNLQPASTHPHFSHTYIMKVNAATLAILAGYIATTSCILVSEGPSPLEIVALKLTTPTKTSEPDLGPTDKCRPPGCRPLEARMPPVVGPKMLTGDNDGPALAYNTSEPCCLVHINSKQSPIENQSSSLQYATAQLPTGTTNTRISVLSMAMGMMTGSRPACSRYTLGNDSNVVADKPEEAEGLGKRRLPECLECCTGRDCLTIVERNLK